MLYIIYSTVVDRVYLMKTRKIKRGNKKLKIYRGGVSSGNKKESATELKSFAASAADAGVRVESSPAKSPAKSPVKSPAKSPAKSPGILSNSSTRDSLLLNKMRLISNKSGDKKYYSYDTAKEKLKKQNEEFDEKYKDIFDKLYSRSSSSKLRNKKYQRRVQQMRIPTPPEAFLSPNGRLVSSYSPTLDIIEDTATRIPVIGSSHLTTPKLIMKPYNYPYNGPIPLSFLPKPSKVSSEDTKIMRSIKLFPFTYSYLSHMISDILIKMNKHDDFAKILVVGRLRDEHIFCMNISSIRVMKSRLFFTDEETNTFMLWIDYYAKNIAKMGMTSNLKYPTFVPTYDINAITPDNIEPPLPATSLQVVGYKTHPFFQTYMTQQLQAELLRQSEQNKKIKGEDYAILTAHGSVAKELSPELKFLANKYLRIIEFGKLGNLLSLSYNTDLMIRLNDILRDPTNYEMFDNTTEGQDKRTEIFNKLCDYISIAGMSLCNIENSFNLVDITHDRFFVGALEDIKIKENHKITVKSLKNQVSMGVFVPVNYKKDTHIPYIIQKELFRLYPGTSFLSKNTAVYIVESLLPIAIRENRRINIIIMSCGGVIPYMDDEIYRHPGDTSIKPGTNNDAIKLLTLSKKYLSRLINVMNDFTNEFFEYSIFENLQHTADDGVDMFSNHRDFVAENNYERVHKIAQHIINFYNKKFRIFTQITESKQKISEMFSFSGIGRNIISNELIEDTNEFQDKPYYRFRNELVKVKIYLMLEIMKHFSVRIILMKSILNNIISNILKLRMNYPENPHHSDIPKCNTLDEAARIATEMFNYFHFLTNMVKYIREGLRKDYPNSFINYTVYNSMYHEYYKNNMNKIYDELFENMDYDRYEGENTGFNERVYKTKLVNPIPPNKFRKTARFMYKYKEVPNVDDARARLKTIKNKIYDDQRINKKARLVKDKYAVSI